jgi:hypothetical protein
MLGFIVPIREKSKSQDWNKSNELLKNTLQSLCNQEDPSFMVFVVYTDMPYFLKNEKVFYIKYPYSFVPAKEITDYETVVKVQFTDTMGQGIFDKGKRVLWGCQAAIRQGCQYVMSVDSDDLVSNKLSGFVAQNSSEKYGWFVNKGYIWNITFPWLIKVPVNMNHLNGSTNIANINLLPEINFDTKNLSDVSFFISHGYLKDKIFLQFKETLKPLPFYTIIYLIHDVNWSGYNAIQKKDFLKTLIKYIVRGKWLSKSIRNEFSISKR